MWVLALLMPRLRQRFVPALLGSNCPDLRPPHRCFRGNLKPRLKATLSSGHRHTSAGIRAFGMIRGLSRFDPGFRESRWFRRRKDVEGRTFDLTATRPPACANNLMRICLTRNAIGFGAFRRAARETSHSSFPKKSAQGCTYRQNRRETRERFCQPWSRCATADWHIPVDRRHAAYLGQTEWDWGFRLAWARSSPRCPATLMPP